MLLPSERVLCRLDGLPEGTARGLGPGEHGQEGVFAVRHAGVVHVYADSCPHLGTPLAWRRDAYLNVTADRIVCAAHGALFEIDSGLCVLGPCLGERLKAMPWRPVDGELVVVADKPDAPSPKTPQEARP